MALYELALLGAPTKEQVEEIRNRLESAAIALKMKVGGDIALSVQPTQFAPKSRSASAALYFGASGGGKATLAGVVDLGSIPVLPIASNDKSIDAEIPPDLRSFNCMFLDKHSVERIFNTLLECVGLLPRQRRIFLSYLRREATPAAVQLFAELSARQYEVFLDTHAIGSGVEFQEALWHQLCDVDVLVMLETPNYFSSRWTSAEYGRALSKGIGVLRIQWPDSTPSIHTGTASRVELIEKEIDKFGHLDEAAINRIASQLESVRSLSHATRQVSLANSIHDAVATVEGHVNGIGANRAIHVTLRSGRSILVQPTYGVPTAVTLQDTLERAGTSECAIVYDHFGMKKSWQSHLDWLEAKVQGTRWIKRTDTAWEFGGWETK